MASHARKRARPAAAAANRAAIQSQGPGGKYPSGGQPSRRQAARYRAPRRSSARTPMRTAAKITAAGGSTSGLLAAELLAGAALVMIRALGDYQLTDEGTARGTLNTPSNGGYGPFTVLAGLIGSFFALSFLAAGGGKRAKAASAFGALIIVVLMIKSMDEIEIVAKYITADPASRTVAAAAFSSTAAQPWGAGWQVSSGASATLPTSSSLAAYGQPFSLSAAGGASSSAAGAAGSSAATAPVIKSGPPES
jgi:hypothetical protein